ncbi:MMPL family transporter [Streptomyces sp. URMC 123]|uniref:MMPL family transporter n=1 Tax=Streptomyces sp. URMC 123 TaxID=3423403 RepID=UPI003F1BFA53
MRTGARGDAGSEAGSGGGTVNGAPAPPPGDARRRGALVLAAVGLLTLLMAVVGVDGLGRLSNSGFIPYDAPVRADNAELAARYRAGGADLVLLVRAASGVDSPGAAERGRELERRVARSKGVLSTASHWSAGDPALRSRDGRAALITVDLSGGDATVTRTAERLVPALTGRRGPVEVSAGGPAWVSVQGMRESRRDLLLAELIAVPLSALVLLYVFRSLVAALLPLITGLVAVAGTLAALRALMSFMDVSVYAANMAGALGFALAVDYGLFVVTRFREERAAGAGLEEAVARGVRTAGRAVVVSACVVALSLCALFVFPFGFLHSVAWAGIAVVLLSAAATVVLVPVLLTMCGRHIDRWDLFHRLRRRPRGRGGPDLRTGPQGGPDTRTGPRGGAAVRTGPRAGEGLVWRRVAQVVCRRPIPCAAAAAALLALLVLPFGHAAFGPSDARILPADREPHRVAREIERDFAHPVERQVTVGLPGAVSHGALDRYARRVAALPGAAEARTTTGRYRGDEHVPPAAGDVRAEGRPARPLVQVTSREQPYAESSRRLVRAIRALPAAAAPAGSSAAEDSSASSGRSLVTGEAARAVDTADALRRALPLCCALAAAVTLMLLAWFTRSLLIPVKAVLVAAVSLTACLGCLVFVFQDGHLRALTGDFTVTGRLDGCVVLLVLIVAYGLSVDYEVFLLSRIREEYLVSGDNTAAVIHGVERTGRVITAASLIVVSAMAALATSGVTLLKVIGAGLAVGVLVDATVVRGVLVPALMTLTGRANWWLPGLRRRPRSRRGER